MSAQRRLTLGESYYFFKVLPDRATTYAIRAQILPSTGSTITTLGFAIVSGTAFYRGSWTPLSAGHYGLAFDVVQDTGAGLNTLIPGYQTEEDQVEVTSEKGQIAAAQSDAALAKQLVQNDIVVGKADGSTPGVPAGYVKLYDAAGYLGGAGVALVTWRNYDLNGNPTSNAPVYRRIKQ